MAFRCCGKMTSAKDKAAMEGAKRLEEAEKKRIRKHINEPKVIIVVNIGMKDMKDMFKMFDDNKNGLISKEEVVALFKKMKIPVISEDVLYLFLSYDTDADNQLSYSEFCKMAKELMVSKEFPVQELFVYFDADDDGFLTIDEFVSSMQCLGVDMNEQKAKDAIPGAEKIDYDSYLKLLKNSMM